MMDLRKRQPTGFPLKASQLIKSIFGEVSLCPLTVSSELGAVRRLQCTATSTTTSVQQATCSAQVGELQRPAGSRGRRERETSAKVKPNMNHCTAHFRRTPHQTIRTKTAHA